MSSSLLQEQLDWISCKLAMVAHPAFQIELSACEIRRRKRSHGVGNLKYQILQFSLRVKNSKQQCGLINKKATLNESLNFSFLLITMKLFWNSCGEQVLLADSWFAINKKGSVFSWQWLNMLMIYENKVKLLLSLYYWQKKYWKRKWRSLGTEKCQPKPWT